MIKVGYQKKKYSIYRMAHFRIVFIVSLDYNYWCVHHFNVTSDKDGANSDNFIHCVVT